MKVYKFFVNIEKEEQWLNEMARKGFDLVGKVARYQFQEDEPRNTIIKIDYRIFNRRADFEDYIALFRDSGWEHIAGTKSAGAQYFKKMETARSEDIFSDADSKAGRYMRMSQLWLNLSFTFLPLLVVLYITDVIDFTAFLNPSSLYYTPGLWDLSGGEFWFRFLFETPFALFRGFAWSVLPITVVCYLYFAVRARQQYHKTRIEN